MKKVSILERVIAVLFLVSTAHATIWYVHPDSTLNSIQAALNLCVDNDTVLVALGTYYENIIWPNTQGIRLLSEFGADTTIIRSDYENVIEIQYSVDTTTKINGFTITHGETEERGVRVGVYLYNASPVISNNIIIDNWADELLQTHGGGIFCFNSSPLIVNNIIKNNGAGAEIAWGGGIYCAHSSPTIINNVISENYVGGDWTVNGGGIFCTDSSSPMVKNCTITHNSVCSPLHGGIGGGIYCASGSSPTIDSCLISHNDNDGVYCGGGSNPEIHYNDIIDNADYGVSNATSSITVNAENNWWGDVSGPYHYSANPDGMGDPVSDYVDFIPWLDHPVAIEEKPVVRPIANYESLGATVFGGSLVLPKTRRCRVFDITGRVVAPDKMKPGIYFIEIDGNMVQKLVKIR